LGHTNLGRLEEGTPVNLEADVIGKYVARLLDPYRPDDDEGPSGD
jgi:riboflavin synthase alpha subunit